MGGRQSITPACECNAEFARAAIEELAIAGIARIDTRGLEHTSTAELAPDLGDLNAKVENGIWRAATVGRSDARATALGYVDDSLEDDEE